MPSSDTQFTSENQPANKGKKKGSLNLKTIIRELWETEIIDENTNLPMLHCVKTVKAMLEKADSGDVHAFKAIAERLEGLPKQHIKGDFNQNLNFYEGIVKKAIPEEILDKHTDE